MVDSSKAGNCISMNFHTSRNYLYLAQMEVYLLGLKIDLSTNIRSRQQSEYRFLARSPCHARPQQLPAAYRCRTPSITAGVAGRLEARPGSMGIRLWLTDMAS